jgi:hypothetical protein
MPMNTSVGPPEIGQWYVLDGKGEQFRVVGRDDRSRAIEIQTFDGELDEIDPATWSTLALERVEPPEDWTAPLDDVEMDDLGYSETAMTAADWAQPLQPLVTTGEAWQETKSAEEGDALGEGTPDEQLAADLLEATEPTT